MEAWKKGPRRAQQLSQSPSPTTPLRRKRKKKRQPQQYQALPQPHQNPHPSLCTPGMASPPPAAPRQRSALPRKHPVLPLLVSSGSEVRGASLCVCTLWVCGLPFHPREAGEGQSLHRRGRALVQWRWNLNPSFVHPSTPHPSIYLMCIGILPVYMSA